jgi:pimeloyl-ACP methyl ester carboxylesterase
MKILSNLLKILFFAIAILTIVVSLLFGYRDKSVADLKPQYAPSPSSFVNIDGMDVHYRDEGNPNDTVPIVLIHGTSSSLHTYEGWVSALKGQNRVVRMDIPAFGLTGPFLSHNYSIANYVDFINKFLKNRGIKHCILGGNSLGGSIAWQFTLTHPDMVEKLILIDAGGYPSKSTSTPIGFKLARIPFLNKIMTFITPRSMVKKSLENVYVDKTQISETLIARYFDLTLREGNRQALVDRMTMTNDLSKTPLIKTLQQPTLVLWGEQDGLIPVENAQHFHDDLPNDTMVILKNMGHVPMEENPTESVKPVLEFLKKK